MSKVIKLEDPRFEIVQSDLGFRVPIMCLYYLGSLIYTCTEEQMKLPFSNKNFLLLIAESHKKWKHYDFKFKSPRN